MQNETELSPEEVKRVETMIDFHLAARGQHAFAVPERVRITMRREMAHELTTLFLRYLATNPIK